jgi:Family of unknown function (DUF6156)
MPGRQSNMKTDTPPHDDARVRYFLTYRGVKLPLQMAEELPADALRNRNTYFEVAYDAQGRMCRVEKRVYGEVELRHDYAYDAAGQLVQAVITEADEEPRVMAFAPA